MGPDIFITVLHVPGGPHFSKSGTAMAVPVVAGTTPLSQTHETVIYEQTCPHTHTRIRTRARTHTHISTHSLIWQAVGVQECHGRRHITCQLDIETALNKRLPITLTG